MATPGDSGAHRVAIIGNDKDFWLFDSDKGFDLTHPPKPSSPPILPRVRVETSGQAITIDPAKSALVIIDMQNFFLSPALGRTRGPGHDALDQLVQHAIPGARKAGIRVVWLNWGLTQREVDDMPPALSRAFGFDALVNNETVPVDRHGNPRRDAKYSGMGSDCGTVSDPVSGHSIDAGRLLMRDQWNTALFEPLDRIFEEGSKLPERPDVWIHKNRMSGMWGATTACEEFLQKEGIRTLLFAGVNTDQCVGGTYQDSYSKGYDCILLSDGCGTTSPEYAQKCVEFNAGNVWGFTASCKALADGADRAEL